MTDFPQMDAPRPGESDHDYLKRWRETTPIARSTLGPPVVFHYRNIARLADPATTRQLEKESLMLFGITDGPIYDLYDLSMLFSNGEAHKRRRGPVSKTFAFKLIEEVRGAVRTMAEETIEANLDRDAFDFLDAFAGAIPARVIARMLGVPASDTDHFRRLVYSGIRAVGGLGDADRGEVERDLSALRDYVSGLLDERMARPAGDFLSDYAQTMAAHEDLSLEEARAQVLTLIAAGSDTTRLAICSTLLQLLAHEDQWRALCEDPDGLKKRAADEGLRFDPSVASFPRVALQDIDIDGHTLPAGSFVGVSTMSAMRDPEVYAEPDRFNIFRDDHPKWHPVFGAGAHRCLGEALARVELEETIAAIAARAPETRLVGEAPKISGLRAVRSIDRMDVAFG